MITASAGIRKNYEDIISVPGDHETMFYDPQVQILADQLGKAITRSEQTVSIIPQDKRVAFA